MYVNLFFIKYCLKIIIFCLILYLLFSETELVNLNGKIMGTSYSIYYVPKKNNFTIKKINIEIRKKLEKINNQMSTYLTTSEISRFNSSQLINTPFPVSSDTSYVISEALRIYKITNGAFDITIGKLVNLWGFGSELRKSKIPNILEIKKYHSWVGSDKISVIGNTLIKSIPELYIDLSSIAKGYSVDVISEYLNSQNIKNYIVEIGGEVRICGIKNNQQPWRIAIERPNSKIQQAQLIIKPGTISIATSGNYRNYFDQNGKRFSHTINPNTGWPIDNNLLSITVLYSSCITADGLATGFSVLGPECGMKLANILNIPVMMILSTKNGIEERYSKAFKDYLN
ncbi:FAD:protein FMN transferase [Serratia symbiotica]|nr:FAD:protein FMN transferase [Serratia symbiotica]